MKSAGTIFLLLLMLFSFCTLPVSADDSDASDGWVQYSAEFSDYTSLRDTGIRFGTLTRGDAAMTLAEGELNVSSSDGQKTYLLLPAPSEWSDTYAVEFTFRFQEVASSNGYCGLILSSTGDGPTGRSELFFRANGEVDGYGKETCASLSEAAADGRPITVRVLVRRGFLLNYEVCIDGETAASITPASLNRIGEGGRGFVIRNACIALSEIRVVSGDYEDLKKAEAAPSYIAPPEWQMPQEPSPGTGDTYAAALLGVITATGAAAARLLCRRRKV